MHTILSARSDEKAQKTSAELDVMLQNIDKSGGEITKWRECVA